jgi:integrase
MEARRAIARGGENTGNACRHGGGSGLRLGEVLAWRWEDVNLAEGVVWTHREKGGDVSDAKLRPDLVAALRALYPAAGQGCVFRFRQGGHLKHLLTRSKLSALELPCPVRRPIGWQPPITDTPG